MRVREPSDLERFLAALAVELTRAGLPFMLIGGQAVLLHGEPRATDDIDVTLGAEPDRLDSLLLVCTALGLTPLPADVAAFVAETFVLPARESRTGLRVDFIFSSTAYERQAIARADRVAVAGAEVPFAAVEDLLVHKLFAGRPRDLEDANGIVRRKGAAIDWGYVERWCHAFAELPGHEEMEAIVARLRAGLPG